MQQRHDADPDQEGGTERRVLEGHVRGASSGEQEQHRPLTYLSVYEQRPLSCRWRPVPVVMSNSIRVGAIRTPSGTCSARTLACGIRMAITEAIKG